MNVSPQLIRQTLFVVISAIENDFREYLSRITGGIESQDVLGDVLLLKTKDRLKKDSRILSFGGDDLSVLINYLDFLDVYSVIMSKATLVPKCDYDYIK